MSGTTVHARVLHPWEAQDASQLSVAVDDDVLVDSAVDTSSGWMFCKLTSTGTEGYIPASYAEVKPIPPPPATAAPIPVVSANAVNVEVDASARNRQVSIALSGGVLSSTVKAPSAADTPASSDTRSRGHNRTESDLMRTAKAKAAATSGAALAAVAEAELNTRPAAAKTPKIKCHHLAWNMGLISGFSMVLIGIAVIIMSSYNSPGSWAWLGLYNFLLGSGIVGVEFFHGQTRTDSRVPARAIFYVLASIYPFFAWPTSICGFCLLCTAFTNAASAYFQEVVTPNPKEPPMTQLSNLCSIQHCCSDVASTGKYQTVDDQRTEAEEGSFATFITNIRREGKVGRFIFYLVYFLINVFVYFYGFVTWSDALAATPINSRLSRWIPVAKGFGYLLDMNCAFIVIPMLRSGLRWLYNRSTQDHTWASRVLRNMLLFLPVDFSIAIHRMIAGYVLVATVGHAFCHLMNWCLLPGLTFSVMGVWPILSGFLLLAVMFIIYAAAFDNVKNTKFEYFWYTHHLFTAFFVLCLMHGRGYWSPNFWKWFLVPGVLYGLERLFRFLKSRKPVSLLSVTMMRPNVISLEFEKAGPFKDGYQEGQYVFLKCPAISEHQWHPFTISSAPCEPTVTLHIRTWGEKSWTKKMADYMSSMMPVNATFTRFSHMSGTGNMAGKTTGPDGQPLFNIDGPHAAPTQHAKEYSTVMLVGGGIGVTPLASSMKEIIFKTWKYSIGQSYPDKAYFYWMVAHNELDSFRWFMRTIKECDDEFCDLSAKNQSMQSKSFEFHIFVTSAPQARDPSMVKITEAPRADDEDHAIWGRHVRREVSGDQMIRTEQSIGSGYTELDMFRACKLLNSKDDGPISLGLVKHVKVWNGRPQWDKHFSTVVSGTPSGEIGVAVCANPTICNDLEKFCAQYSSPADNRFVILHKENF